MPVFLVGYPSRVGDEVSDGNVDAAGVDVGSKMGVEVGAAVGMELQSSVIHVHKGELRNQKAIKRAHDI